MARFPAPGRDKCTPRFWPGQPATSFRAPTNNGCQPSARKSHVFLGEHWNGRTADRLGHLSSPCLSSVLILHHPSPCRYCVGLCMSGPGALISQPMADVAGPLFSRPDLPPSYVPSWKRLPVLAPPLCPPLAYLLGEEAEGWWWEQAVARKRGVGAGELGQALDRLPPQCSPKSLQGPVASCGRLMGWC